MLHEENQDKMESVASNILVQFKNEAGEIGSPPFDMPVNVTAQQLQIICNSVLKKEEPVPFLFFVDDVQIKESLASTLKDKPSSTEKILDIVYAEQAVFRVRPVTRCTSSLPGHAEAVISASFSPDGRYLASGSGDTTVRLWDVNTETPQYTCKGHKHWVLCISWSPNGMKLASGCKNGQIMIWDPKTGKQLGRALTGHGAYVSALCWEPLHLNAECRRIASASKDRTVRIWDVITCQTLFLLSSHTAGITCVKWGGTGLIYSSSQDRTIIVWRASDGTLCRTLQAHGHWVNTIALNTDYLLRTGPYDPSKASIVYRDIAETAEELSNTALKRYNSITKGEPEIMISGSDDFTMYLWTPENSKKPLTRMTGHQNLINDVKFSPDMRLIASASFDKSIKIWNGRTGKFISTLRGHVQQVYQISWSADSRLLVSGSADSTLKVWDLMTNKIMLDLPGHADEVYAVDWSPDGQRVVSGGKDKVIKIWRR
ncbi:notchless protein homolog 1-like [Uloborus diversus]|uniref:notchless protein homolog 1-like n=1 Tax=Uloborus diversus TaxID=327109 RepID=UPI002409651F|nr:notchless protein homolog 1-like [Uloborus diversus]XP_054712385.1 notchless protein homolog 1-like [Uloborus diversus]XP_054712386.1 notchless protein homolog 1-like [Uloborus diversus]XP_054712387.1 notchless protein homolog 1-like [Uloborus diversus]